jgi:3',5'-cyclic AMP phosphodiesterase CpdA
MRILHFSDIHVQVPFAELPKGELVSKRFIGLMNLWLRRAWRFTEVEKQIAALGRLVAAQNIDLVICTGDYTAIGTEPELRRARQLVEAVIGTPMGYVTVPGNHDIYLNDAVEDERFEFRFGDLMETDFPEFCTHGIWPIVKTYGDDLAVVCVNSARPNPQPWRSSGRIPESQLAGLARAVSDARIRDRFIIVATHYAPRRADGTPDVPRHGLTNHEAFERAVSGIARGMIVHGHLHDCFHLPKGPAPLPIFGAGSATDLKHNGLWVYDFGPAGNRAYQGSWGDGDYVLSDIPVAIDSPISGSL